MKHSNPKKKKNGAKDGKTRWTREIDGPPTIAAVQGQFPGSHSKLEGRWTPICIRQGPVHLGPGDRGLGAEPGGGGRLRRSSWTTPMGEADRVLGFLRQRSG